MQTQKPPAHGGAGLDGFTAKYECFKKKLIKCLMRHSLTTLEK